MARKHKSHVPHLSLAEVKAKAERAAREGRFQQALELSKQVYKEQATPEHQQLVCNAYLGRTKQLREQGHLRDAAGVAQAAVQFGGQDPTWLGQIAEELAAVGEVQQAMLTLQRIPDSPVTARVMGRVADAALQQGEVGRKLLSESLRPDFDCVRKAWNEMEASQDEQARATLQAIGLRSPFAEWKLLVRGLLAYYQNDNVRAQENWQRLDTERLPARMAAPFRFRIDADYRLAQQPAAQIALQKQGDRIDGHGLVQPLRELQAALARDESLDRAFKMAGNILPTLRTEAPGQEARLASCFYWAILNVGGPRDIPRYQKLFGAPADDLHFHRLSALGCDRHHEIEEAHKHWQLYEKDVAAHPTSWPGDQALRVRALIWQHMGRNASSLPSDEMMDKLPPFLRNHPDRPKPLNPSAEKCFLRSLELAPDQLETHEALFEHYRKTNKEAKAIKAGKELLQRFPNHGPTLESLGDLYSKKEDYTEALVLFQRAHQANPLDRGLRDRVAHAHLFKARAHAEDGEFDEARAEYQTAMALNGERNPSSVLCKWAACEFKAGDAVRAEELLQQALSGGSTRLAVAHSMLIEVIRLKLPRALKNRFDKDFKEAIAEPPTAASAVEVAVTMSAHQMAGITYHGQKTHDKKVLGYLDKAQAVEFTEDQLKRLCAALMVVEAFKQTRQFCKLGQRSFPASPFFPFMEAESYIALGPLECPTWKVTPMLEKARKLAEALPPDDQQKALLEDIRQRLDLVGATGTLGGGMLMDLFDQMLDPEELDDDWDEDEDDW